ncbi:hypothetical protein [Xylella fastidiosa]|uniref:DUF1640 domain-containing protein n=1 Tax=Xylella fastidiosa subsp. sandyi Ann-1 TaxID=155920 RepID=A0A060H9B3_XYLFS|nr:hypothetical protein [Xylella fastidiosa]AIC09512.1 hypothetical protein D934_03005 [Xylella fastidiosa subsp. sandyi Ann-1]AIC10700.1 hypothetical protein D934_12435 [Xylella fastidiosa subsp. sandyi Ann-1]UIX80983.1 DUF1640 domain-containing protein [Xylella fastidiosa subsp. sandyi]UIX81669.1 DUF1640 domain-containing protein [Xylella fastidiosa subsp. sandyi]
MIDTFSFAHRLKSAGIPAAHAEAEAKALAEVLERNLQQFVTKRDLRELETSLEAKMEQHLVQLDSKQRFDRDMRQMRWMCFIAIVGIMVLLAKSHS